MSVLTKVVELREALDVYAIKYGKEIAKTDALTASLLEAQAEDSRLVVALGTIKQCAKHTMGWKDDGYGERNRQFIVDIANKALALESPATALQEYRDYVLEECAQVANHQVTTSWNEETDTHNSCAKDIRDAIRELKHD